MVKRQSKGSDTYNLADNVDHSDDDGDLYRDRDGYDVADKEKGGDSDNDNDDEVTMTESVRHSPFSLQSEKGAFLHRARMSMTTFVACQLR